MNKVICYFALVCFIFNSNHLFSNKLCHLNKAIIDIDIESGIFILLICAVELNMNIIIRSIIVVVKTCKL